MSVISHLQKIQQENSSIICLGLDLDVKKVPQQYANTTKGLFDFALRIIDATQDIVCAYKPNLAFYESLGAEGISLLKLICDRIPKKIPIILDGKRGDIGNTASQYARFMFERLQGDWVTVNPYMGYDSMRPFLEYKDKGVFVLCLTSNTGSKDFQMLSVEGKPLYHVVAEKVAYWNKDNTCGLVVGATHPEQLQELRVLARDMPLLIPGVGAQGGALEKAVLSGTDGFRKPAVINVSRSVLYASREEDFAQKSRAELIKLNEQVTRFRAEAKEEQAARDGRPPRSYVQPPAQPQAQPEPKEQSSEQEQTVTSQEDSQQVEPQPEKSERPPERPPESPGQQPQEPSPPSPEPDTQPVDVPREDSQDHRRDERSETKPDDWRPDSNSNSREDQPDSPPDSPPPHDRDN
jgi:orotidine-5'-phosphate decarboxylase